MELHPDHFRLIPFTPDTSKLLRALEKRPDLWEIDRYWKHHPVPVFREVDSIILRFPDKAPYGFKNENARIEYNTKHDWKECYWQPIADDLPQAYDLALALAAHLKADRIGRVTINRLPEGKAIPWHSDIAKELKYYDRYHIVLKTNPDTFLQIGNERATMPVNTVWWFENACEHRVENNGSGDRWHMIVELKLRGVQ